MAIKANLDALIPREDFEIDEEVVYVPGGQRATISIDNLEKTNFFYAALRKPDFQRETSEWEAKKIAGLIESFVEGDLIPALILWKNPKGVSFVIDGSHRISALVAWINDDYGDGEISFRYYQFHIPEDQKQAAITTRKLVNKQVGSFADYKKAIEFPNGARSDVLRRIANLGSLAIQLQWVVGDASKAESSFFKINRESSIISQTETRVIEARKKPSGIAARAIIRSGKGHKYWSKFPVDIQNSVEEISSEINNILYTPPQKSPIKTLELPIAGRLSSSQTLPLILDFITIVNASAPNVNDEQEDLTGTETIKFLTNCRRIARRINSDHLSSFGLHPAVYFYSQSGSYKPASFLAITSFILEMESRKNFDTFLRVRETFESLLLDYEYLIQHIVRQYRLAFRSHTHIKDFYVLCIKLLNEGKNMEEVVSEIVTNPKFLFLKKAVPDIRPTSGTEFSDSIKVRSFFKQAIPGIVKCSICNGYLHPNSMTYDHIIPKREGGLGTSDNIQLAHPYCNSTLKQ